MPLHEIMQNGWLRRADGYNYQWDLRDAREVKLIQDARDLREFREAAKPAAPLELVDP